MAFFHIEIPRRFIPSVLQRTTFAKSIVDDAILDPRELLLQPANIQRAEKLAIRVRNEGIYRFGPMWAEKSVRKGGRTFDLQASDRSLVIHVPPTKHHSLDIHIHWDRSRNILNTYHAWNPQLRKSYAYFQSSDKPNPQKTSSFAYAAHRLSTILDLIKLAK